MKKIKNYTPSQSDMEAMMSCMRVKQRVFSIEKCGGGYNVVSYKVDEKGVAVHKENNWGMAKFKISYMRVDRDKPDEEGNRVVFKSQYEAEKEMFNQYKTLIK
jgi:hypothetical protein